MKSLLERKFQKKLKRKRRKKMYQNRWNENPGLKEMDEKNLEKRRIRLQKSNKKEKK